MNQLLKQNFKSFFILSIVLLWIKTYLIQLTQFDLGIENELQKFLLVINPLGSSLLLLGLALFYKGRKKYVRLLMMTSFLSILLYMNILYFRFFNDFVTLPTILQTQNFGDVSTSVLSLMKPYDILFFIDSLFLIVLYKSKWITVDVKELTRQTKTNILLLTIGISFLTLTLAEIDRPQLLSRGFDRSYIVKYLGVYNYTIYDAVQSTKITAQRVMADSSDTTEIVNFSRSLYAEPNEEYFGTAKGMNVIYLHLESMQNFLINYQLHGEEVTPFLNSLTKEENTLYFDNFFHQTAQGKTADAEFMLENSLYGLPKGSAFTTKGSNTYQAAPAILSQEGYTSAVFHGNEGTFWNRKEMYRAFGYDHFFDEDSYIIKEEERAEYGLMDKPFYEQSIPLIETLPQPFMAKLIPVTHHYPYPIKEKDATIAPHTTGDKSVDRYFQTARYADEALAEFFQYLKESGLYENSMIVMYGDHYGISENHKKAMKKVLGKNIDSFENAQLQRVPLFIHVPGIKGGINHTYSGQIDILPTVLHLLGIDTKSYIHFGTDILSKEHNEIIPFRNGEFVSPSVTRVNDKFYDSKTGEKLKENAAKEAEHYQQFVFQKLGYSDKVVNGDLLRFYTPNGFKTIEK